MAWARTSGAGAHERGRVATTVAVGLEGGGGWVGGSEGAYWFVAQSSPRDCQTLGIWELLFEITAMFARDFLPRRRSAACDGSRKECPQITQI